MVPFVNIMYAKSDGVGSQIWGPFVTIPFTNWNMAKKVSAFLIIMYYYI